MGSQLPALEKLFDEWSKKHAENLSTAAPYYMPEREEPYGGFVRDGIINLESWKTQKVRICFILNEAGGRDGMEHYPDNFDLAAEWNERGSFSKFMFKLSVWTKAIQDSMSPNPTTYKKADVVKIRDELIRSIAVVNIKKSDGQRRTDFDLLQRFACEDADEIRRELEILRPNIIICTENMKFLREPLIPKPPKNKKAQSEEGTDTTVTEAAETVTAETATPETVAAAETAPVETVASAETAEAETSDNPAATNLKYVFSTKDLQYVSKFAYLWGNTLVFSLWTPANFFGTISSNTINYYAIREIVRAALKAFSEMQRRKKVQQTIEENTKKKAERKAQHQAELAAKQAGETPAPAPKVEAAPAPAPTPQPSTPAPTPASEVEETKPKTRRTAKKTEDATATAEDAPPKTARKTTKKAAEDTATAEEAPKKTTRRTKKVTIEE